MGVCGCEVGGGLRGCCGCETPLLLGLVGSVLGFDVLRMSTLCGLGASATDADCLCSAGVSFEVSIVCAFLLKSENADVVRVWVGGCVGAT